MKNKEIPYSMPYIDEREIDEVVGVLKGKWITTGAKVNEFEGLMKDYLGVKTAVAVSSCTAALDVSLAFYGVGEGDEVLTTAYTFASAALSVIHRGAVPVFADIEGDTFNIDPGKIETLIHENYQWTAEGLKSKKTGRFLKGIIPVHFGGQPAEMEAIAAIAREYNLFIIEDAAHAVGALHKGKKIGKSNHMVCFSFYSNKNMTTGEGGMIVTDHDETEEKLRMYSLHGLSRSAVERYKTGLPFYDIVYPGFKANLTDIHAALGVVQVKKLPEIDRLRNRVAQWYDRFLADVDEITPPVIRAYNHSARHLYPVLLSRRLKPFRDDIIIELRKRGIYPSVHFIPVHFHSFFKTFFRDEITLPVTEDLFYREISLPIFPELEMDDVARVADVLKEIIRTLRR
ncbi:MAG: DegT/DnrJ/EryC1/StrS aminotransferase family protein [bacterium]|nr:DegT/DnrJ/EryC1/StrS aminotransferase family protein [bacterium]